MISLMDLMPFPLANDPHLVSAISTRFAFEMRPLLRGFTLTSVYSRTHKTGLYTFLVKTVLRLYFFLTLHEQDGQAPCISPAGHGYHDDGNEFEEPFQLQR